MSNKTKSDTQKRAMIKALESSLGVVTTACKKVGIARDTHYRWMREDLQYADEVNDLSNVTLDFAESKLHEQIMDGNTTAIIFFLKTKGKARGYVERSEVVLDKAKPDLSGLSDEEIMDLIKYDEGDFA